jgi:hypothetical protein
MQVRVDRGGLGRGAGLLLALATTLVLLAPSAARAAELPLVDQVQQQLSQTVQDTGTLATEQVVDTLPAAARRVVAQTPAREVPRSVDDVTAAAADTLTGVDSSGVEAAVGDVASSATGAPAAAAGDVVRQTAPPSAAPPSAADVPEGVLGDTAPRERRVVLAGASRRQAAASGSPHRPLRHLASTDLTSSPATIASTPVVAHDRGPHAPPPVGSERRGPEPVPPGHSSPTTGATAGSSFLSTGLAVLVAALGLGASRWRRRLTLARVGWRPRLVVGVLERPG